MRAKRRYVLVQHRGSVDSLDSIRKAYAERFGATDLENASLKVISDSDGFLIVCCDLDHCKRLMETLASTDSFVTLNMSGTLKALRTREESIKKSFSGK